MDHHHHHHEEMDNFSPNSLANGEIKTMTGDAHSCHMKMAFYFGTEATVLFDWWKFNTTTGLIYSMVGIFLLATLYEGLKYFREYLFWKSYNAIQYRSVQIPLEKESSNPVSQPTMLSSFHFLQTFLHVIQITVSYLLMLIFMTYNVWLCLAVLLGATLGYFLFGWKKSVVVDVTEHCH
ncbi:high affinity copper uptake protein 1-like isoform X2 [Daktulosphaira vitifoliae]|uniref:high affinity copper uptake protein 1-like isoform X2 n=1 Tax=Daktulosphaira vitifoliae TaxID=58002 RepID=UPI0021A99AEA|nr:high affinity copper uptake protein 1-like isoform X2 [Daktulosphaira vitifoliae]